MTYEQFREYVGKALEQHVSRDTSLVPADLEWEADNFARTLARNLRVNGFNIPDEPSPPPVPDYSQFEGR